MKSPLRIGLALAGLLAAMPAFALYKVVGPDGRVSYTDRPPMEDGKKVEALPSAAGGSAGTPDAALPFELRQVVQRHPVTLYTAPDCAPCDEGRALLRQRGVPHAEKTVSSAADAEAFRRLGGQSLPLLQVGTQQVRHFSESEWKRHLDAASYPAQSRLPRSYGFAKATPLVEPKAPEPAAPKPAAPAPKVPPPPAEAPGTPPGFRF